MSEVASRHIARLSYLCYIMPHLSSSTIKLGQLAERVPPVAINASPPPFCVLVNLTLTQHRSHLALGRARRLPLESSSFVVGCHDDACHCCLQFLHRLSSPSILVLCPLGPNTLCNDYKRRPFDRKHPSVFPLVPSVTLGKSTATTS